MYRFLRDAIGIWDRTVDSWRGEHAAPVPEDVPATVQDASSQASSPPATVGEVRRTLTRTVRDDLSKAMVDMCRPEGWRQSTLNPDLAEERKLAILIARMDVLTLRAGADRDRQVLYGELLDLAAVATGWAQGIARRRWRDTKRAQRSAKRARRAARQRGSASTPEEPPFAQPSESDS